MVQMIQPFIEKIQFDFHKTKIIIEYSNLFCGEQSVSFL